MTNEEAKSIIEFFYHDILNTYKQRTDLQCALDKAIASLEYLSEVEDVRGSAIRITPAVLAKDMLSTPMQILPASGT